MKVLCDNYEFDFIGASNAFKFDEADDKTLPNYHGKSHCMKAVDLIAEYDDKYYFVELKAARDKKGTSRLNTTKEQSSFVDKLKNSLISKYFDSFVYRYAQNKIDKPIDYLCVINIDNPLLVTIKDILQRDLTKDGCDKWVMPIVNNIYVTNEQLLPKLITDCTITPQLIQI